MVCNVMFFFMLMLSFVGYSQDSIVGGTQESVISECVIRVYAVDFDTHYESKLNIDYIKNNHDYFITIPYDRVETHLIFGDIFAIDSSLLISEKYAENFRQNVRVVVEQHCDGTPLKTVGFSRNLELYYIDDEFYGTSQDFSRYIKHLVDLWRINTRPAQISSLENNKF